MQQTTAIRRAPLQEAIRKALGLETSRLLASATLLAVGGMQTALAQSAEDAKDETIDEIVVSGRVEFFRPVDASSATKFNLAVQDTPQAITVITDDILETFHTKDLIRIDKFVANVNSTGSGANTNFFLGHMQARGFTLDQLSGYKINGFSAVREFQPDFVAVDRIEFVKGPSSVVYGVNNYGGTVNLQLKEPTAAPSYSVDAEYGSYGSYRLALDTSGPISDSGSIRYRFATAYDDRQSVKEGYEYQRLPAYGRVQWDITPATTLDVYGLYQDETAVDDFGNVALRNPDGSITEPFAVNREIFQGSADYNEITRESYQLFTGIKHEFDNGLALGGKLGYVNNNHAYQAIYLYSYGEFYDPYADVYTGVDDRNIDSWDAELSFGGDFDFMGQTHTFLVLAEQRDIDFNFTLYPFDWLGSVNQFSPDFSGPESNLDLSILAVSNGYRDETQERTGIAGQVLLRPTDRLSVLLGLRSDRVHQDVTDIKFDPDPDDDVIFEVRNIRSDATHDAITTRAGLVYALTSEINTYVSYSEGFLPQEGITRGGDTIDPEEGYQIELGVKGEFLDGKLGATFAGFYIQREKIAIPDPTNNVQLQEDYRIQGGEQQHEGFEIEVYGEILPRLNVVATYAQLDTEVTKEDPNLLPGDSSLGNPVIGAPEKSGGLFLEYEVASGFLHDFAFSAGMHHVGERPSQSENMKAEYYFAGFPIFYLDSYTTVDAGIRYFGWENWVLSVNGTNLTNEDYFNPGQLDADCCSINMLQRGQERQYTLSAIYSWGR